MSGVLVPPVLQSGTVTPRQLVVWTTDGVIQDAGTPSNPLVGGGLGFVSANDQSFTVYNAPKTGPGSYLSLGITPTAANLTVQNYNGGAVLPFNIIVNGVTFPFPGPTGPFLPLSGGTLSGPGNLTIVGTLAVDGVTNLFDNAIMNRNLNVAGVTTLSGATTVANTLNVTDVVTMTSTLTVTGTIDTESSSGYMQDGATVLTTKGVTQQVTLVGRNAGSQLPSNDTGTTAIGFNALAACSGVTLENTAVGWGSLRTLTTGAFNTACGLNCGGLIVSDNSNALFGNDVMRDATGGANVAVGNSSMRDGAHSQNVAIGHLALNANLASTANTANNVAIGFQAMLSAAITTANANVFVGYTSGQNVTSAQNNSMIGPGSGLSMTSGFNNSGIGRDVLHDATTAFNNVAVGFHAGQKITTGTSNLVLGPFVASTTLTTGANNIVIGVSADADTAGAGTNNTLVIQGAGTTAAISGTALNTAAPLITIPGIFAAGQFATAHFTANASVATALTSVGPVGSHTTVQEWFTVVNQSGVTRYIPCF